MVDHKTHRERCRKLLGDDYAWVHRYMDQPYKILGRRHRVLRHDEETALLLAIKTGDPRSYVAAMDHLLADGVIKKRAKS
jgi:hypothetical protein